MKKLSIILLCLCMLAACGGAPEPVQTTAASAAPDTVPPQTAGPSPSNEDIQPVVGEDGSYLLTDPSGSVKLTVYTGEKLEYTLFAMGRELIGRSELGITLNGVAYGPSAEVDRYSAALLDRSFDHVGATDSIRDYCVENVLEFALGEERFYLVVRLYENGAAIKYVVEGDDGAKTVGPELTSYKLCDGVSEAWYGTEKHEYEPIIEKHSTSLASDERIQPPLTAVTEDGGYIALLEAGVSTSYPGYNLRSEGDNLFSTVFFDTPTEFYGRTETTWRVINFASDLNGLVNNYNVYCLCPEPDEDVYADTSWIEYGRASWSWGYDRSVTAENQLEFTLNAARLGFEYNLVDAGWTEWADHTERIKELTALGKELNLKQILWCGVDIGDYESVHVVKDSGDVAELVSYLLETGAAGAKVDFWWDEYDARTAELQTELLTAFAEAELAVDLHGCAKSMGWIHTYPNELTREGVRGLEYLGEADAGVDDTEYASYLTAQLFTRYLGGQGDWTPQAETAMHIASLICIDSPLMCISTAPDVILASPAVEFIKSVPTVWDRTLVLEGSDIGRAAVYARLKDGSWFVGGVFAKTSLDYTLELSQFLTEADGEYFAELWYDTYEGIVKKTVTVTAADSLPIEMARGTGFALRLTKLVLSSYGGEISEPITAQAPEGALVRYTLDGSDPMTSDTAVDFTQNLRLEQTCRLRIAIVSGDGAGTELDVNFCVLPDEYSVRVDTERLENAATADFTFDPSGRLYYTLDGSEPTEASSLYIGGPITVTDHTDLKWLYVTADGESSVGSERLMPVPTVLETAYYDVALTDLEPLTAEVSWGAIYFDESMAPSNSLPARKITLGSSGLYDGAALERGVSANSGTRLTYAIPEGAVSFVGIAGIDGCVYSNSRDCVLASAGVIVRIDGAEVYSTGRLGLGDVRSINVGIPEGAAVIEIIFDDCGDGGVCDNLSLGEPGFVLDKTASAE